MCQRTYCHLLGVSWCRNSLRPPIRCICYCFVGSLLRSLEFCGRRFLPCELDADGLLDTDKLLYARHEDNNRRYVTLEEEYCTKLLQEGYDDELAGSISVVAQNATHAFWLSIGGGNRKGAVVCAAKKEPRNPFLSAFVASGGFSTVWYRHDTPAL